MASNSDNLFADRLDRTEPESLEIGPAFPSAQDLRATVRRVILQSAAALLPRFTARHIARRYLSTNQAILDDIKTRKIRYQVQNLSEDTTILRLASASPGASTPRLLLVPGHDGHVRQFIRVVRALHKRGAQVDFLVLPGHARQGRGLCTLRHIVDSLQLASDRNGPYDGVVAHCVAANAALEVMRHDVNFGRVALISAPIDLPGLIRQGGEQYGLSGPCLAYFVDAVADLSKPYRIDLGWHDFFSSRQEPAMLIHARSDYAAPVEKVRSLARAWPGAELVEFDNGGHNEILNVTSAIDRISSFMVPDGT